MKKTIITVAALAISGTQSVILNFYHYDDDQYPYVYAHSYRDLLSMVNEIDRLAKRAGTEMKTPITITASEYWPLPWYLRDYEGAGFFGSLFDANGHLLDLNSSKSIPLGGHRREIVIQLLPRLLMRRVAVAQRTFGFR